MKLALHSVSYSGAWPGQVVLPLEKIVDKAAEFGYDGVEIVAKAPHASPMLMTQDDRKRLKDRITSKGLELCCLAGYFDFSHDNSHADMPRLQKELLWMRETLRLAADLGAPIVRTYAGFFYPTVPLRQQWQWAVEGLKESARMAEDFGVILGLQNHSEVTQNYKDVLEMIQEVGSPALKATIDCAYIQMNSTPIDQVIKECGDMIVHSHTSDHLVREFLQWVPPGHTGYFNVTRWSGAYLGEGAVDYRTFFKALKDIGYKGYLSYEICGPIPGGGAEGNLDFAAKMALAYQRKLLAELG
jgi:sugar phosphate isomerase/epimerase